MKLFITLLLLIVNLGCKSNLQAESTEFRKGIGLIISEEAQVFIYSDVHCNSIVSKFSSYLNEKNRIFENVKSELTNFKNFEFGYEEYFVPVVEVLKNYKVYKVIYQDIDGNYKHGYVSQNKEDYRYETWAKFLIDKPLFFVSNSDYIIFEYKNGPEIDLEESSFLDHIMWPAFERDGWIQVKLITPSDYCIQKAECSKIINGAIRYLDSDGNLLVWYHTRGC